MMPRNSGGQGAHFIAIYVHVLQRRGGLALGVVGVSGEAEANHAFVRLLGMNIELRQAREVAENNRKNSGGRGIEGSEMADRALPENSPHAIDHVVRGQPGRFIDDYDTIHGNL